MIEHRDAAPVRWYRPAPGDDGASGPTLLWLHGGGFFRGSPDQPEAHDVALSLAEHGVTVATAGYRLTPTPGPARMKSSARPLRGRFPDALDDVFAAYRDVLSASPSGVMIGGASAGACLAAAATLRAIDDDLRPAGAVFAYGFFHSTHPRTRERRQRSRGHRRITHSRWALNWMNRNYAGSAEALSDRLAFPGGHDLDAFPRTLVINAEHDNMRASGDMFAAELGAAGVDVRHHIQAGSRHAFLNRPSLDAFASAISLVAAWTLLDEHAR
ncbi:acetyl esterase/lipase [Frondihabitans sp. PhB188]|uniref:alpha/beta hydrolase n=1 Tax=Frondihabitans sp. PhB188 TaxID=2485200 RepID=UPI000F478525|nr:alpha/beta hydrolase [Frondihabitans sp. PhB188]ROQ40005.1 acetyl esterase/lipase [Frondihabitans sp. PhB188]